MDWEVYTGDLDLNLTSLSGVVSLWLFYYFYYMNIYDLFQTK